MQTIQIKKDIVIFFILCTLLIVIGYYSRHLILISSIGLGVGVLISPCFRFLTERYKIPRMLSMAIVVLTSLLFFFIVMGSIIYLVADQAISLQQRWPEIQSNSTKVISETFDRFPWIQEQIHDINFASYLKTSVQNIFKGFKLSLIVVGAIVFAMVLGFYSAFNANEYFENTIQAFYPKYRKTARDILSKSAKVIRIWFRAQLIDMAIIGSLTGVGLRLVGVEYWAVFGLLTAVLGIIPYLGIFMVVFTTLLITLSTDPSKLSIIRVFYTELYLKKIETV